MRKATRATQRYQAKEIAKAKQVERNRIASTIDKVKAWFIDHPDASVLFPYKPANAAEALAQLEVASDDSVRFIHNVCKLRYDKDKSVDDILTEATLTVFDN